MPNALAVRGETLYVADGGDNAVAEVDLASRRGPRLPARRLLPHGRRALAATARRPSSSTPRATARSPRPLLGQPGNAHDFQGTVTVIDLTTDLAARPRSSRGTTAGSADPGRPPLKVYNGAIKHVLYIIKENRTYDEVFGDLPRGQRRPEALHRSARR